jgi:cysteine-rich repeat protein
LGGVAGAGWCMDGRCVQANCGDGTVGDKEECDLGDQKNGAEESDCTVDCKIQKCGNGKIEGTEECDDGNQNDLDSCDHNCKSEFWFRYTQMAITKEAAPDWCVYSTQNTGNPQSGGNQFGNAFPSEVTVPLLGRLNMVDTINSLLSTVLNDCSANTLNQVTNSSDLSFQTTDGDITIGVYDGALEAAENTSNCAAVDNRFSIKKNDLDANNATVAIIKTAQRPGLIRSINPADIALQMPGIGSMKLYQLLLLLQVDTKTLSTPKAPPAVSKTVNVVRPEKIGFSLNTSLPAGRLCSAVGVDSLGQIGITGDSPFAMCCKPDATTYRVCNTGNTPGKDCDSLLDVMKKGCLACATSLVTQQPVCGNACISAPIEVMRATQPDVDVDGDGVKDAYSGVFAVEGVRVRVTGIK